MRRVVGAWVVTVVLLAGLAGCEKQVEEEPVGPPQPLPAQVLATVSVRSGAKLVAGTRAFIDAMKPGTGAILSDGQALALLATLAGVPSLDGVDLAGPLHLLVADDGQARGAVVVGRAAGKGPKERSERGASIVIVNGWVIAGPDAVVELVRGYAVSTLVTAPAPEALTITVDLPKVLTRYRDQIAAARAQVEAGMPGMPPGTGKLLTSYLDGSVALAADMDRLVIELSATRERGVIAFVMAPKAGTRLAAFVAAQRPTDQTLLGKLPAGDPPIVAVARLALGPYRESLLALFAEVMGSTGQDESLMVAITTLIDASTGEVAATMSMDGGQVSLLELFGVSDDAKARAAVSTGLRSIGSGRSFETMGIKTTTRARVNAGTHDGVALGSYETEVDVSSLPAGQPPMPKQSPALVGVFDGVGMIAMTEEGLPAAARTIDAARGKAPRFVAGPRDQPMLAESLALEESMIMLMDFERMMRGMPGAPPMPIRMGFGFGLGFTGGKMTLRLFVAPR